MARIFQRCAIAGKFLPKRNWRRILRMRAANLDNVLERYFLILERFGEVCQSGIEALHSFNCRCDMDCSRESVIR
ncbi:hypothetical protein D3C80_2162520 [compost metagenome]